MTVEVAAIATPELSRTVRWTGADPDVAAFWEGSVLHLEVDCSRSS